MYPIPLTCTLYHAHALHMYHAHALPLTCLVGGSGFSAMGASPWLYRNGVSIQDALTEYLSATSPVAPRVMGRISDCTSAPASLEAATKRKKLKLCANKPAWA